VFSNTADPKVVKEWLDKADEDFRFAQTGQEIEMDVRDKEITARIVDLPFYRKKLRSTLTSGLIISSRTRTR